VDDRPGRQHLRIEQRMARQMAVEDTAVPVRPVHHRCATKFPVIFSHLAVSIGPILDRTYTEF
jgi:hypothetical protein